MSRRRLSFDYILVEADTKVREGLRLMMYRDTKGILTIGYGHNLQARPITKRAAQAILEDDMEATEDELLALFPWVVELDPVRQMAVFDMAYNMGANKLKNEFSTPPNGSMCRIERGEFAAAGTQLRQSKWYDDVGSRAERVIRMLETGSLGDR
jgi:lysozyme